MKDYICVYLDFSGEDEREKERVVARMEDMLRNIGWRYSGFRNAFFPVNGKIADLISDEAEEALEKAEWLKKYSPRIETWTLINACKLDEIRVGGMSYPSKAKLDRYRKFYSETKKTANPIVVDENNKLRDGYTSYIIANEENAEPNIIRVHSSVKIKKLMIGRHVYFDGENFNFSSEKYFRWYCKLDDAVVPGDILLVNTAIGNRLMKVEKISLATGNRDCSRDKSVKKVFAFRPFSNNKSLPQ